MNKTRFQLAALSLALVCVNTYVCRELFRIEYLGQMGSIEALFITLSRYARDNWRDLTWFPLWYNGIPYQNTYPPFLPMLVTAVTTVTGWSPALAYHFTVAFVYCTAPVLLFWLCFRLSRSVGFSFFAGVLYSVVTPSAFLIPEVQKDLGSLLRPRRLQALVVYGEGPHVLGLALLALSILLLDLALEKRRPHYYVLAALSFAGTVLTNWLAAAALAFGVIAYCLAFARFQWRRHLVVAIGVGLLAYAFAAPWIPLSTIRTFQFNSLTIEGDFRGYERLLPLRVIALVVIFTIAKFGLTKLRASRMLQLALYFTIITGAITVAWQFARVAFVPQPHRYNLELDFGLAMLLPFALQPLLMRTPRWVGVVAAGIALLVAIPFVKEHRRYARDIIRPIDITQRVEYKSARWIDQNLRGSRVMVPGSTMFWLNTFTDTAQLGGADDQGTTNFLTRVAAYVITSSYATGERDAEISLTWLDAFGVNAIEIGGPKSGEYYKPFQNPLKFDGVLQELWRDGDDVIYRVPQARASLAHAMTRSDLPKRVPVNGLDIDPIKPYVAALEDASFPAADLRWTSRHSAEIRADLRPEHLLSVQITHHPGWHAEANGKPAHAYADAMGQMVIEPGCNGPCTIELSYDGGPEMWLARIACWLALFGSAGWITVGFLHRNAR